MSQSQGKGLDRVILELKGGVVGQRERQYRVMKEDLMVYRLALTGGGMGCGMYGSCDESPTVPPTPAYLFCVVRYCM